MSRHTKNTWEIIFDQTFQRTSKCYNYLTGLANKRKKWTSCTFASHTHYIPCSSKFPVILWVQHSAILSCLLRSFLKPTLNIIFLINTLPIPLCGINHSFWWFLLCSSRYHMTYINCFAWLHSSNTAIVIGT